MFNTFRDIWKDLKPIEKKYLALALWLISAFGLISIFILPRLFTIPALGKWMEFNDKTSNVSNTINGIAAPFIALASAILTFFAFWVQYQANIQQRELFDKEVAKKGDDDKERDKTWRFERFENRFYELLKLHKQNVDEMNIGNKVFGRKCFMPMFYEFRFIYKLTEKIINQNPGLNPANEINSKILSFAYKIFFFGIGPNSEKHFMPYFRNEELELYKVVKTHLLNLQNRYAAREKKQPKYNYYTFNSPLINEDDDHSISLYYFPFDGHITQLGHYYRHLFQVGKYIYSQSLLDYDEKYSCIKILRAQLSNFEQLLLYYNALAWFDEEWKPLFVEYRLIKNLPLPLADFDERPEDHFADDIERLLKEKNVHMFEWDEA
jgi:hypothetical protein